MERLKVPPIERINCFKTYGNKYLRFWRNWITREDFLTAYICGETKIFKATQDGVNEMEEWINTMRAEIEKKLHLEV